MNTIELRNIRSLSGMNFFIPDYQRGYRWTNDQAIQMLEDFKEFCKRIESDKVDPGEFYCLQPIVVKPKSWQDKDGKDIIGFEVIDGQQRLTTIFIILKCLEPIVKVLFKKFEPYTINYETRLEYDSQSFLESIDHPNVDANEFIDFYYMNKVYQAAGKWLDENSDYANDICSALLNQSIDEETNQDRAKNIRVLWYEVTEDNSATSIDIFTRLNIGKIPLTNAELIKALLLRKGNFAENESTMRQLKIAAEWNYIEQKLQDNSFWYFLYRTGYPFSYENRIEFVFDVMKRKAKKDDPEFYFTFNQFNEELRQLQTDKSFKNDQQRIEHIWGKVKNVFQTFEEWFEDRQLYHYIGFLIEYGADINELNQKSLSLSKTDFIIYIKSLIKNRLKGVDLDKQYLSDSKGNIRKTLLLFNILTALKDKKSDMRFPFNKYKTEKWDIEHISSQTDKVITEDRQRDAWVNDILDYFTGSDDIEQIEAFLDKMTEQIESEKDKEKLASLKYDKQIIEKVLDLRDTRLNENKYNETEFNEVYEFVQKYFGENNSVDKDSISNLALLDQETNRSYGNAFFPIKRKRIIANDQLGIFVPIATKNVFLKYYSRRGTNLMKWYASDAEDYLQSMKSTLNEFLVSDGNDE